MKEICVRCGRETAYDVSTPVTVRKWYVEGAGQLCEACFHKLYPVPGSLENKNCRDLGQKPGNEENDYSK